MPSDEIQFPISGEYLEKKQQVHTIVMAERDVRVTDRMSFTRAHTKKKRNKKMKKKRNKLNSCAAVTVFLRLGG